MTYSIHCSIEGSPSGVRTRADSRSARSCGTVYRAPTIATGSLRTQYVLGLTALSIVGSTGEEALLAVLGRNGRLGMVCM